MQLSLLDTMLFAYGSFREVPFEQSQSLLAIAFWASMCSHCLQQPFVQPCSGVHLLLYCTLCLSSFACVQHTACHKQLILSIINTLTCIYELFIISSSSNGAQTVFAGDTRADGQRQCSLCAKASAVQHDQDLQRAHNPAQQLHQLACLEGVSWVSQTELCQQRTPHHLVCL